MEHYGWDAGEMSLGDVFHEGNVRHPARAFVVHDDIEPFGPIRFLVNAELVVFSVAVAFMENGPGDIRPGANAFGEDFLLGLVIMTAAPGDEEGLERRGAMGGQG